MAPIKSVKNILMELRKICQHPYLSQPELESLQVSEDEQQLALINASGKLQFLKLLLPKLKERGHRVLLFSQFKIALDRIEDFLYGEGVKFLRLDGDVQQAQRQKSMDLFNAPNSEYDVFLLTTRAGGVGINLATADTVIIYDPDFNPHQDLQAIARSHRYGQTKKVLVFKLMIKGSVEENIINKGKKKMVLDHLVVQQMNQENEDGDVDNLLLQGAQAVFSNQGGINVPDIVYNSKNVDELIDKVEADAEAEAKAMEERDRAIANGEAEPTKSVQQFGFAKIWEAEQNELREIEEEQEGLRPETDWSDMFETMEKEKRAQLDRELEGARARRRKAAEGQYNYDGVTSDTYNSDNTPKKKTKFGGKRKRKTADQTSSDTEFAINPNDSSSDDDDASLAAVPEGVDVLDENDQSTRGKLVDPLRQAKRELKRLERERLLREVNADSVGAPGASNGGPLLSTGQLSGSASPTKRARQMETPAERALRKAAQKEAQRSSRAPALTGATTSNGIARPATANPPGPQLTGSVGRHARAQFILQWLWQILCETGGSSSASAQAWGMMALPEIPPEQRWAIYVKLAAEVDRNLKTLGQNPYFSQSDQKDIVFTLFKNGGPVIPEDPSLPPVPPGAGLPTANLVRTALPPPHVLPPVQVYSTTPCQPPLPVQHTVPAPQSPHIHLAQSIAIPSLPLPNTNGIAQPAHQRLPLQNQGKYLGTGQTGGCDRCRSPHHTLKDCKELPSVVEVDQAYVRYLAGHVPPEDRAHTLQKITAAARALAKASRKLTPSLHNLLKSGTQGSNPIANADENGTAVLARGEIERVNPNMPIPANSGSVPIRPAPIPAKRRESGTREEAIVVDDDDDDDQAQVRRTLTPKKPKSRIPKNIGCVICESIDAHPAMQCPVVHAGPESIRGALSKMDPQHALYSVLQALYHKQVSGLNGSHAPHLQCAFCETPCGRDIRSCATEHGGRKPLKEKLKILRDQIDAGDGSEETRDMQFALYEVYQLWPKK